MEAITNLEWGLPRVYKAFTERQLNTEETKNRALETTLGKPQAMPIIPMPTSACMCVNSCTTYIDMTIYQRYC